MLGEDGAPFTIPFRNVAFFVTEKCWVNNHAHVLSAVDIDPIFLTHSLNCVNYEPIVEGATREKLTQGNMNKIDLPIPSKLEQEIISKFLEEKTKMIDNKIHYSENLFLLLKEKRQSIINQAVTKGLDPSVPMKDSGIKWIGKIPEHWKIEILKNFSTHITKGLTPTTYGYDWSDNQNDILFLRNECIKENQLRLEGSLRISKKAHDYMMRSKIIPGDILISITGEIGKTCLFPEGLGEANINQHIARIRVVSSKIFPRYLVNLLNSKKFYWYFQLINQGLTHAHLNLEQVRNTKILSPPTNEQKQIAQFLKKETSKIGSVILKTESQTQKLQEYRQSLISAVVTGKVDVRNYNGLEKSN